MSMPPRSTRQLPPHKQQQQQYSQRLQTEDVSTFMEVSDVEKIDMILESPSSHFKGNFDPMALRSTNYRVLGTLGMTMITYLYTSGGPVGSETIIQSGGPLIGLSALVLYPLFVAIPYAYIVAELCSAFPEDGGFTIWVLNAFGPFWAFQVGYWAWISGIVRSALIPGAIFSLFLQHFDHPELSNEFHEWLIKAGIALLLAVPTLFGTVPVSRLCFLLVSLVVLFFAIYSVWALTTARDFDDLFEVRHEGDSYNEDTKDVEEGSEELDVDWDSLMNVLFFKFDGVYMASVFGGEVMNPSRTYPRAILFTVLLTVATYLIPLPSSIVADSLSWLQFDLLAFPRMADAIGGSFLKTLILIASVCGAGGAFVAGIFIKGFMVNGMAANRLLPAALARRSAKFESPTNAILITTLIAVGLTAIELRDLLLLSNAFATLVQFLILVTAMRLRMTLPYIPRPTKVPGGIAGLMAFAAVPTVVLGYILLDTFLDSLIASALLCGMFVVGMVYGFWAVRWN